jgi:hypothetical protein
MADAESATTVNFGEIFTGRVKENNDFESNLLDYSKPSYSSNFLTYTDCIIQPSVQPYDSGTQVMRWDIGGPDDPLYTSLDTMKVVGRLKVLHEDGTALTEGEEVSCVNLFPESCFNQINVFINGLPVSDHGRGIQLKSYLNKHYSCSQEIKNCSMQNDFYIGDDISYNDFAWEDITSANIKEEKGLVTRSKIIAKSRDVHFCFKPCFDLANSERAFPPGKYHLIIENYLLNTLFSFFRLYPVT